MPPQAEDIRTSISHIINLSKDIPISIPIGNKRSKIHLVMTSNEGEDSLETFNKQFDALFAENCHDVPGWLHHICHGEVGMDMDIQYLSTLDINLLPLDLVAKKIGSAWSSTRNHSVSCIVPVLHPNIEGFNRPKTKQTKLLSPPAVTVTSPLGDNTASSSNSEKPHYHLNWNQQLLKPEMIPKTRILHHPKTLICTQSPPLKIFLSISMGMKLLKTYLQ